MTEITVATINLRNRADRWSKRRELLVSQLVDAAPDLIGLQEISMPIGQGRWLRNQINARLTGSSRKPYRLLQKRKHHLIKGYYEGVGILTRLPVLYHDYVALGYGGRVALRANVELPNRQPMDFVTVHLHHVSHDKEARLEQVMKLTGWLATERHNPLQVVVGDFNELPAGLAIQYMKQGYRSAYAARWGHEPLATFPTALVSDHGGWAGCIDYIFLSPAVDEVRDVAIFCDRPAVDDSTLYPSDHVGLIATIAVG